MPTEGLPTAVDEPQRLLLAASADEPSTVLVEAAEPGGVRLRLPVAARNGRPGGTASGTSPSAPADAGTRLAVAGPVAPTSLHVGFLRKPAPADVVAEGKSRARPSSFRQRRGQVVRRHQPGPPVGRRAGDLVHPGRRMKSGAGSGAQP